MEFKDNCIIVTDKTILGFYKENPELNFIAMNHTFIGILKSLSTDLSSTMNNTINSKVLAMVTDLHSNLNTVKADIISKFHDSIKEYVGDVRTILQTNSLTNNEKIGALLEKNNDNLLAKTTLIVNDVIPKSQDKNYMQIENCIKSVCSSIAQDTTKLLELSNKDDSHIDAVVKDIESRFSSMISTIQQPIFSFIQSSEDRTSAGIQRIKDGLLEHQTVNQKLNTEMGDFLNKYNNNSSSKGNVSEAELYYMLQSLLPSDEIVKVNTDTASCDLKVNRMDKTKPSILFENKDYTRSVPTDEVKKFERDIRLQKAHGVFVSQKSPITFKGNFQIDIIGGLIHIYVPNAGHDANKIKIAIDIIDNLSSKLETIEITKGEVFSLSKEEIDDITEEYRFFVVQKMQMIDTIKAVTKQLVDKMEDFQLPAVKKMITKLGVVENDNDFKCNFCSNWAGKNKASLGAHIRNCKMNPKNKEANNVTIVTPDAVEPFALLEDTLVLPSTATTTTSVPSILTESVTLVLPLEKDTVVKTKKVKK
jgi:hypothetical protein